MLPVVLLLLLSHEVKGSITETLFVQTGKDLLLDVKEPVVLEEDPVSPVKVTVSSCSSESSNLTVTCSTVDAHISSTFRCDRQTCSEEGGERSEDTNTTRPSSITVYLEQGFIICNHSNHVSWKQDKKKIKSFCESPNPDSLTLSNGAIAAIGTGGTVALVLVIGAVLFINYKKRQKGQIKMDNGNTEYADPEEILSTQTLNQNPQEGPTSTYAMVNFHTGPEQSNKPKHTSLPETIYAQDPSGLMVEDLNEPLSAGLVDLLDHSKEKMNTNPVSPVKVTVSSCSSESCNLTVTCSTVDAHISSTFRCDNKTCSEEGGERSEDTTRPSSITVYLEQGIIICNHSNHVSWKQDKKRD
ncbi:hypothetical protein L3Q82_021243 [Scortum barcoo]|uniref:Uncharacterized protein n=1 Tax=Scortum barcoo TaxID=214431 RepID=A0ACB8X3K5_9TELE|nr:hypothetical protein L3Q82_021243 [Scortum barcoo]